MFKYPKYFLSGFTMAFLTLFAGFVFLPPSSTLAQDNQEKFEDYEIRVIRPKYFQKSGRFELGAQFNAVMNETFIYTFLATGLMTYHFNEILAIEGAASYGFSINKEDKRILFDEYRVRTQIFRTTYMLEAALQWTPIYGKWQLPSGRLVYFDTFLAGGGGLTGVEWKYSDFCSTPAAGTYDLPADTLKSYPTFLIGGGQRFYVRRDVAVKWDIRSHWVMYDKLDAECNPEAASSSSDLHTNITMQLGASKFF